MKRFILSFIVGGFFILCLVLLWGRQYQILTVKAEELTEDIENGYLSLNEEDIENTGSVLCDYTGVIALNENSDDISDTENDTYNTNTENVSEDSQTYEESDSIMNDDQFRIMCIFCFGLCSGIIVGHFLTGFIK